MELNINLIAVILAFSRISAFLFMIPVLKGKYIPSLSKVTVALSLSFAAVGNMPELDFKTMPQLTLAILIQVGIGITLGYVVSTIMTAASMAGGVMDMDVGFSMVNILDPSTSTNTSVLQALLSNMFYLTFIVLGGLSSLMTGIVASMKFVTPVYFIADANFMDYILSVVLYMLTAAVQISLPMTAAMFILNITMLIIGKSSPQFNIFMNGIGIKIAVGIIMLCLVLPFIGEVFTSMNEVMLDKFTESMTYLFQKK